MVVSLEPAQARAESVAEQESLRVPSASVDGSRRPGLDSLLQLPSGYLDAPGSEPVGGADERVWRRRFRAALKELESAEQALERTKAELDEVAGTGGGSQWSVAPPGAQNGGGPATGPLSFKLRQTLARNRERLDDAERALRSLRIEADLAGVPSAWRGDESVTLRRRLPNTDPLN